MLVENGCIKFCTKIRKFRLGTFWQYPSMYPRMFLRGKNMREICIFFNSDCATVVAAHGATESQSKRLGGWRSDVMPSKYIDLSLPSRISMSQRLQKMLSNNYCSMCAGTV